VRARARGARPAFLAGLLILLLHASGAWAHASLVRSEPVEGAINAQAPTELKLIFNEPVTPLVMRLVTPAGEVLTLGATAENSTVTLTPPPLRQGTHVLSWRVVSADGHPVGGTVEFSVGTASAPSSAQTQSTGEACTRRSGRRNSPSMSRC
jgi:copper transport protein